MTNGTYIEIARINIVTKGGKSDRGWPHTAKDLLESYFKTTPINLTIHKRLQIERFKNLA